MHTRTYGQRLLRFVRTKSVWHSLTFLICERSTRVDKAPYYMHPSYMQNDRCRFNRNYRHRISVGNTVRNYGQSVVGVGSFKNLKR